MPEKQKVLVITGPTATGKTALSVELALRLGGEVISADSMQIYRGMDIGTAKVTRSEMRGVPHHLLDVADPAEPWSVARWVDAAVTAAEEIFCRGHVPIITGGTNLYIDSLLSGRDFAETDSDGDLRASLGAEYDRIGGEAFREKLLAVDPERGAKLHASDKKRLIRALEVYALTGETISAHDARTRTLPPRWDSLRVALGFTNRETLYARIDARVREMLHAGLIDEVRGLLAADLPPDGTAMQAIGYKEIVEYLSGACSAEEAEAAICRNSRRYAKRQLTWLRRDTGLHWILWDELPDPASAADQVCALWTGSSAASGITQ